MPHENTSAEMNDTAEGGNSAESPAETSNSEDSGFKSPQDVERKIFSPENLTKGSAYITDAVNVFEENNLPVQFSFEPSEPVPDDYSLAVIPLTETIKDKGRVSIALLIAAIPSVQSMLQDATGAAWAVKKLNDTMIASVKVAASKIMLEGGANLPFSIADFASTGRSSEYAAFNAMAGDYVKALKKKSASLSFLSKVLLRQILASKQFAEQQFPRIDQRNWVCIIEAMVKSSATQGIPAGILQHWLQTRDDVEVELASDDLSDIGDLVAADKAVADAKEAAKEAAAKLLEKTAQDGLTDPA